MCAACDPMANEDDDCCSDCECAARTMGNKVAQVCSIPAPDGTGEAAPRQCIDTCRKEGFVCTKMGRKDDCCFGLTCDTSGKCVKDCTNVKCGRTGDKPCCPGSVCVNHHCTECPEDIGCSECPNGKGNSPLGSVVSMTKVCADVSDRVGQATCGDVTCNAICSLACGGPPKDGMKYAASNCNNARGGNCQGVQSTFTPFPDFKGGPCCGCNSCDQVPE
jgi:hypothetical protein